VIFPDLDGDLSFIEMSYALSSSLIGKLLKIHQISFGLRKFCVNRILKIPKRFAAKKPLSFDLPSRFVNVKSKPERR